LAPPLLPLTVSGSTPGSSTLQGPSWTLPFMKVHPPKLILTFAAAPDRLDTLPHAVPDAWLRCLACLGLHFVCSPPFRSHDDGGRSQPACARSSLSSRRGLSAKDLPDPPRLPPLGFLAPSTAFASPRDRSHGSSPPGILQPDPGFEVHGVAARGLPAQRPDPKVGRSSMGSPGAFPPCVHTLRRLLPRRQPYRLTTAVALLPFTTPPASTSRSELPEMLGWHPRRIRRLTPRFRIRASRRTFRTAHPRRRRAFPPVSTRRRLQRAPA